MRRKFYLSLLLISGLVLFAYTIIAGYREATPEWKKYQVEYKRLLILNAKDEATREKAGALKLGHRQLFLGELGRVDRCTYCHVGVDNPLMARAKQPYRQHSGDILKNHPVSRFGCTVCHNGQGRATNKKEAHGEGHDTHWDYPILPLKYIQSSCARCHDTEMLRNNGGEKMVRGEELFREKGCKGCHKLNRVGGDLGKVLDGIGSQPFAYFPMRHVFGEHTVYNWIKEHFDQPWRIVPDSKMRVFLTEEESDLLTNYILTIRAEEIPRGYRRILSSKPAELDGKSLYTIYCIACHGDGKVSLYDNILRTTIPAVMNPAFLKTARDKDLKTFIKEGRSGTVMTAWKAEAAGLTDPEIDRIIGYLTRGRPEVLSEPFGYLNYSSDPEKGKKIYGTFCQLCHGEKGEGGLGVNLRNPAVQEKIDPEFLAMTVRDGREGTPMPSFGEQGMKMSNQEIADVVSYVKTFSAKSTK